ncbi:CarD family transcriptional regulator [Acholeplasma equirhinis]|uniref:CarD family transcriptional regulator n=1 Tax=Acholeplasma equirhinis TaxID=555393 RepID=UPI0035588149
MINVGDLVNHPNLGLCKVISIETIENEKRYLIQRQDKLSPTRHEVSGNLISIM